jgi:uncharacterized protein (UPF0305 family)
MGRAVRKCNLLRSRDTAVYDVLKARFSQRRKRASYHSNKVAALKPIAMIYICFLRKKQEPI